MKKQSFAISADMVTEVIQAVVVIAVLTAIMGLVGRPALGEAVIAMLYMLAVGWLTSRSGRLPGLSAALSAALMFDFFFIPPFLTFSVGSVEGWLVLAIFVLVAVILVDRIQVGLALAQAREHEALLLYELSMALVGRRSRADVAVIIAERLQQIYQAAQVEITLLPEGDAPGGQPAVNVSAPPKVSLTTKPDRVVPLLAARGLIGEIRVWHGEGVVMANADRLLQSLASQMTLALERMALAPSSSGR